MRKRIRNLLLFLRKKLGMSYTREDHRLLTEYLKDTIFVDGNITTIVSIYDGPVNDKLYFNLSLRTGGLITIYFEVRGTDVKLNVFSLENLNLEFDTFLKICNDIRYLYTLNDDNKRIVEGSVKNLLLP